MNHVYKPFLEGHSIYLRPLELDDVEGDYLSWVNDSEIRNYMGSIHFPTSRLHLEKYITSILNNPTIAFFAIVEKKDKIHIGNVKVGPIDWINRKVSFGRMIGNKSFWGKGIGTEVTKLVLQYAFDILNLNKVNTSMSSDNIASIKSNEKAGLTIEGTKRQDKYENGKYRDVVLMGIVREEYYQQKEN